MSKYWTLLLLFASCCAYSQSQTSIREKSQEVNGMKEDTLKVNQLNTLAQYYTKLDTVKAFRYNKQALTLSQKLQWQNGIASSHFCRASIYNSQLKYSKALHYFTQSLQTSNTLLKSKSLQKIGEVYLLTSDFSQALKYLYQALRIDETIGNKIGIAKIYANLGSVYYGFQKYEKALGYYFKSAQLQDKLKNYEEFAIVYRNIGGVYNSLKDYDKALLYYEKANSICKLHGYESMQARLLSDISLVYFNLENFDKAMEYCYRSLNATSQGIKDQQAAAFSFGVLGDSYIEKAKIDKNNRVLLDSAISNLHRAISLHKQLKNTRDLAYDFSSMTKVYKLQGNYKKAIETYELAMLYEDSVFNFDNKETIKNLEDSRAIALRDREIKISKLKLEAKEKQKWIYLFGLTSLGILGGLLYYQSRNRKKINKVLLDFNIKLKEKNEELDQANKTKARFFSILNHDLRRPVYNLIHFLHLQRESPELLEDGMKHALEEKTIKAAESLLTSMEDLLLWSKGQMEFFQPQPTTVSLKSLFADVTDHFNSEEKVNIVLDFPSDTEILTDENCLKTVIRNLTSNAIKAVKNAENPTIIWTAFYDGDHFCMTLTDNGKGAAEDEFKALYDDTEVVGIKTGLGLHVIRDLAKVIGCEIKVDSKINVGTTFTLIFK